MLSRLDTAAPGYQACRSFSLLIPPFQDMISFQPMATTTVVSLSQPVDQASGGVRRGEGASFCDSVIQMLWSFKSYHLFTYLLKREREIFPLLTHSPNASNGQGWARLKSGAQSGSPSRVAGTHVLALSCCLPECLPIGSCSRVGASSLVLQCELLAAQAVP